MEKVIIIGCPGAGKSCFARRLAAATGLPLYYLDLIWHNEDRTTAERDEFDQALRSICLGNRWIIDGNYIRTLEMRLQSCDTVFLLDYPLEICLAGAESRLGKPRVDMPWTDEELDPEFREFIEGFPDFQLPVIRLMLERYESEREIIIFHSREEAEHWFDSRFPDHGKTNPAACNG